MTIAGTKAAFLALIAQRGSYRMLGVDRSTVASWKKRAEAGEVSVEKMEEVLASAGAIVEAEKKWRLPADFGDENSNGLPISSIQVDEVKKIDLSQLGLSADQVKQGSKALSQIAKKTHE